jgi:hypothetical protein
MFKELFTEGGTSYILKYKGEDLWFTDFRVGILGDKKEKARVIKDKKSLKKVMSSIIKNLTFRGVTQTHIIGKGYTASDTLPVTLDDIEVIAIPTPAPRPMV